MNNLRLSAFIVLAGIGIFSMAFGPPLGLNIGNTAPELTYTSPEGKEIALSSLRGQLVLVDFWASWCGPCRLENPNLVKAYSTFSGSSFNNGDGFTIYSVSLDRSKSSWMDAIEKDKLSWPHHVSDLLGWSSEAALRYDVNSIPDNYLIDGNGVIIAKKLRGDKLHAKLSELQK